jgi:hypothetical protein
MIASSATDTTMATRTINNRIVGVELSVFSRHMSSAAECLQLARLTA